MSSVAWAIEKDSGSGPEILPIADVEAFLAAAELTEYKARLDEEGIILDDISEVTDELLQNLRITKIMHRKRFLRYAKLMRPHKGEASGEAAEEEKAPLAPWVINKDIGKGKEVVFIPDLQQFLEVLRTRSPPQAKWASNAD